MKTGLIASLVAACAWIAPLAVGQDRFADTVGPVRVGNVQAGGAIEMPYITWGGDVATFNANGGLTTTRGSIYGQSGLNLKLVAGDDFAGQVRRYLEGKTPFLRGTMRMIGQASEVIGSDPRTKPVVFLQLTWSAGDHMVAREHVKTLADLRGQTIALQRGGPHVGMLDDALRTAQLDWDDVVIVWVDELTGPDGAAERFRRDQNIDACMVITPDMLGLTGGLEETGSGAEGTVRGATVAVSTAEMSRSIADVYCVRKDYFDANRELVEKIAAGYIKSSTALVELRTTYDKTGRSPEYEKILKMTQDIYGPEVIPTLEVDAHGLLLDATFVGLPGNEAFFTESGVDSFQAKQKAALDLAVGRGYARVRAGFLAPNFDFGKLAGMADVARGGRAEGRFDPEFAHEFEGEILDDRTIVMFTISFEPNQERFDADDYGPEFLRAIEAAGMFGNAVVAIRGHSDPTRTLSDLVKSGLERGVIKRTGKRGNYKYFFRGKQLDLNDTDKIVELIEGGAFAGSDPNPLQTMQAALNLSRRRAESVKSAVAAFAAQQNVRLDLTQIQPVGVGVAEPVIAKPINLSQAKENMRVEFRVLRVPAEAVKQADFDF